MTIARLLHLGQRYPRDRYRRFWLHSGLVTRIGRGATMRVYADRRDDDYRAYAVVSSIAAGGQARHQTFPLEGAAWLDLTAFCGLICIGRAIEVDRHGRPTRVLMEFVDVHDQYDWVTPAK